MRLFAAALLLASGAQAVRLTDARLDAVADVLQQIARFSWENGTKAQAFLEADYPSLSVFSPTNPFPVPDPLPSGEIPKIIDIAATTLRNRPDDSVSANGGKTLLEDEAAGDPPSLGVAVLLANASTNNGEVDGARYGDAAEEQLRYLLYDVPRTSEGAISHRRDQAQLWADNVFMVPPFLAYYGVLHNNQSLVTEAYRQCSLYRDVLRVESSGLWQHILLGTGTQDTGLWATGNAWAAQGMLRVLATIKWSQFAGAMQNEMNDLQSWTEEILRGCQRYVSRGNMLHNYLDQTDTFEESSATALIAASALRLSTLNLTNDHVALGLNLLSSVSSKVNSTGYVTQVVNPYDFGVQGPESAEAQSFIMMAYAAYDQWTEQGRPGNTGGDSPLGGDSAAMRGAGVGMGMVGLVVGVLGWSLF